MNKILKASFIFSLIAVLFFSCNEDWEKESFVMRGTNLGGAMPNVTFLTGTNFDIADMSNTNIKFIADVAADGEMGNYTKLVISKSFNGGEPIEFMSLTPSELPKEIELTPEIAIEGLGNVADISGGSYFDWEFMVEFPDTSIIFNPDALNEAFPDFRSFFVCAFDINESVGIYEITLDDFGASVNTQFEVTAGPGENEITIHDIFGHGAFDGGNYDIVVQVDPASGAATIATQDAWNPQLFGLPENWGIANITGNGYVLSCSQSITFSLTNAMNLGGWDPATFEAIKVQ